jgi:hypothetical protein
VSKLSQRSEPRMESTTEAAGMRNRTRAEELRRKATVQAWIAANGPMCPGWDRALHMSKDLTADHVIPRFDGGEHGPLRVLCRTCNVRRRSVPALDQAK